MTIYLIGCCFMYGILLYEMRDDDSDSFGVGLGLMVIAVLWPLTLGCYVAWICECVRNPKQKGST